MIEISSPRRYTVALLLFAISLLGRIALSPFLGEAVPYITFFPAIAVSAWYGGLGPGLTVSLLSSISSAYLFFKPGAVTKADVVGILLFLGIGTLISWLNHALHRSQQSARNELLARQQSEVELRDNEERYRVMTEAAVDGIITIDEQSNIVFANPGAARIFGYSREELYGSPLTGLMPEYLRELHRRRFQQYLESGEKHISWAGVEWMSLHKSGHEIPVEISFGEVRLGFKRLFTGIIRDITDRKRAEDELKRRESRFQALIENSSDAIALIDAKGVILYASKSTAGVLGYLPEECVGRNSFDLVHPDERRPLEYRLVSLLHKPDAPVRFEMRVRHADGSWCWIETILTNALKDPHISAIVVNYRSTGERRRLEEQLLQSQKMEAIGRLAGGIAHDFNNLLTIIQGYSAVALDTVGKESPVFEEIDEVHKAALRAASLTKQLLAFSRRQVLEPKILNLNHLVSNMDRMLKRLIGEDVTLVTVLQPTLESVRADPGQIEQAIMNLAVNSRHAMRHGGRLTIETANVELDDTYARLHEGALAGHYVMLAVSDTGTGMDEETKRNIFEPFFTTKPPGEGTGLGLSMVYGFVKQSGGTIWVYSEPGQGTTFKIYLPRVEQRRPRPDFTSPSAPAKPARGSETILIVEDEESVRKLIHSILQKAGYTVLEARNGSEALLLCETHSNLIHLLFSDVVMPQMSGPELAARLALLQPEMKVLFMSGYTDNAVVLHGIIDAGMPFLQKPFTPAGLTGKVREVLQNYTVQLRFSELDDNQ